MGSDNRNSRVCDSIREFNSMEPLEQGFQGETGSYACTIVRIERYSVKTADLHNAYTGIKPLIDCLCLSKLIRGDDPSKIAISYQQFKVAHLKDKKTVIKIRYPR